MTNGVSWQRVVAIALFVAGALGAYALGAAQLATALGSGALLAFPLGRLGHRPLADQSHAVEALRRQLGLVVRRAPEEGEPLVSEATAKFILDQVEGRKSAPPKK